MESNCGRGMTSTKPSSGKEFTRDPYTCERLTQIRGGYTPLTSAVPVLRFDFTNPEVWLYVDAGLTTVMNCDVRSLQKLAMRCSARIDSDSVLALRPCAWS